MQIFVIVSSPVAPKSTLNYILILMGFKQRNICLSKALQMLWGYISTQDLWQHRKHTTFVFVLTHQGVVILSINIWQTWNVAGHLLGFLRFESTLFLPLVCQLWCITHDQIFIGDIGAWIAKCGLIVARLWLGSCALLDFFAFSLWKLLNHGLMPSMMKSKNHQQDLISHIRMIIYSKWWRMPLEIIWKLYYSFLSGACVHGTCFRLSHQCYLLSQFLWGNKCWWRKRRSD